jgi:hypothetical protein
MSDPTLPAGDAGAETPIDPQFEQALTAALHDHARTVTAPVDPSALTARLVRVDKRSGLARLGFATGAVVIVLLGVLVFGASRRDSEVRTAGSTQATAVSTVPGRPGSPGGTDPASPDRAPDGTEPASGTTSDVSIPLPGEVGPDGSTSTTAAPTPGGVTTSSSPGAAPTTRPGSPPTTGAPGTPTDPNTPTTPTPTVGPTVGPTSPTTGGPPPSSPTTPPPTTPLITCSANQLNRTMPLTTGRIAGVLAVNFDSGLSPAGRPVTISSDDAATRAVMQTPEMTFTPTSMPWRTSVRFTARTAYDHDYNFYIQCTDGVSTRRLPFTVRRVRP